jgi:hypothetical protein
MSIVGNVKKRIKKYRVTTSASLDQRIFAEIVRTHGEFVKPKQTTPSIQLNLPKIIIRSRIAKLAAVLLIVAGVFLTVHLSSVPQVTSVAYGISDVPGLLRDAKTLHVKGSCTYHLKGQKPISCPVEYWVDFDNLRFRKRVVYRLRTREGGFSDTCREYEDVSDTTYRMSIDHTDKTISYLRSTPFRIRFIMRTLEERDKFLKHFYLGIDQLEGFERVGQEEIDGSMFDIWEKKDNNSRRITKYSINPETGKLGRYFRRFLYDSYYSRERAKDGKYRVVSLNKDEHEWHEHLLTCIERDKPLQDDIFKLEPPSGYTVTTCKMDAPDARPYFTTAVPTAPDMKVYFRYTLGEDDSVIMAWSDRSDNFSKSQEVLFDGLEPGDPLPELTFVPYALHPNFSVYRKINEAVTYIGRHLAHTRKGNVHFEWSIYVPDSEPPESGFYSRLTYSALVRRNPDDGQTRRMGLTPDTIINSEEEFDALVLGGMAELSNDGKPPKDLTYKGVLQLAQNIRDSIRQK